MRFRKYKILGYGIPKRDGSGRGIQANSGRNPSCLSKLSRYIPNIFKKHKII